MLVVVVLRHRDRHNREYSTTIVPIVSNVGNRESESKKCDHKASGVVNGILMTLGAIVNANICLSDLHNVNIGIVDKSTHRQSFRHTQNQTTTTTATTTTTTTVAMAKWSNRAAVLWLLAVIQAYYFLTSDGSEDGVYAGTGRMLSRLLVGESATTKDSPSVTPAVVIPSQPVQSVSIDVNGDYVLVDCVQTCKECTSPTDQYLDVDKLEVVSDCDGCLADTVCYQVDGDASKQQCLMENGGLQVHHPTVYIGEAVAQNATHGKDLDKPRFSSPLTMICQKEANAEPTVGLSRAPTSYLMQATATLDHEQKQERQQSAGLCVDNAGNVQLTSIGGYDMEHHDSPLLWTKNMAAYDDYTAESPIASSSSTASTGYSVGIRHIYGAIVGGNNLNKGQNAGTAALVRASQGSLSLVHLEGFDDAYIAPDDNSALIDTTRPVSFLHTNYARAFKTLFTSICGLNYEEKGIILPETIVSYASFPTIFLQLESHLNHEGVGVPTTLPGFVGKKHDADHPYDVLLAIRPEHYLHIDWESRVALPTIHFSSKQSSIGLDALKQHTIVLDVTHKRIGLAQQQACVPIGAIEKGKGNNMDWYAAGATTGAATGLGRFGNGLKKEKVSKRLSMVSLVLFGVFVVQSCSPMFVRFLPPLIIDSLLDIWQSRVRENGPQWQWPKQQQRR